METEESKKTDFIITLKKAYAIFAVIVTMVTALFFISPTYNSLYPTQDHEIRYSVGQQKLIAMATDNVPYDIMWDGKKLSAVFHQAIYIWNSGKSYIDEDSVTETYPLYLEHSPKISLIKSIVNSYPRRNIGLSLGETQENKIPIFFGKKDALAKNEGLYIEVYYTGSINSNFKVKGIIKGANSEPFEQALVPSASIWLTIFLLLIALILINSSYIFYLIDIKINKKYGYVNYIKILGLSILAIICLILFIVALNEQFSYKTYVPTWLSQAPLNTW
ncbi:MAG: hypothetical protein WBP46_16265 [Thiolinea sp.]